MPFIYHPELEGTARERGWYMNGVSWATMIYLFNILTMYHFIHGSAHYNKYYALIMPITNRGDYIA